VLEIEKHQKKMLFDETQRIKNLAQVEIESSDNLNKQLIDNLQSENDKLMQLNETRAAEIARLYGQVDELREKGEHECEDLRLQIENLKGVLHTEKQCYDEENEAMKIKLAHLRHSDLHSLQEYYQN
jgi:hypothetical protein